MYYSNINYVCNNSKIKCRYRFEYIANCNDHLLEHWNLVSHSRVIDLKAIAKKLNERKTKTLRQRILAVVPNDEDKIEKLCKGFGLINLSETIYLYLNNTIEEVAAILEIDNATVNRRVRKFLKTVEV